MVEEHGFTFIGPSSEHIRLMGDKVAAKATAKELGLPVVPGTDGRGRAATPRRSRPRTTSASRC